jgi:hypothetical protein
MLINLTKTKLIIRGDLYKTKEETYTITLAALIAAFDLETC